MRKAYVMAAVFCLLLQAVPARAADTWSKEGLTVQVKLEKDAMLHKPGKVIPVTVEVREPDGTGVDKLKIHLSASRGEFADLKPVGKGVYRASYTLPSQRHPQVVILAAKVAGAEPAWATLRLRTKVSLPTKTSKPRVQVTLELGGRSYGPVRSDERGNVKVPVEVGPGEIEARAVAVDEFGNRKERKVRIPIPDNPRLTGFAERTQLAADGHDATDIYLIAVEPNGDPAEKLKVVAIKKSGKIGRSKRLRPGLYLLRYTAPAKLDRTRIVLTLADKANAKLSRHKFVFSLTAGRPTQLTLKAEPAAMFADGKSTARLVMTVSDRGGNPLEGFLPKVGCPRGVTKAVREEGAGTYSATYIAPAGSPGQIFCKALLSVEGGKRLKVETSIDLKPPIAGSIDLMLDKKTLPMDGKSSARIDLAVYDQSGTPLEGVALHLQAGIGSLDPVSEDGRGRYHATYTAPRGEDSTRVRIEASTGQGKKPIKDYGVIQLQGIKPPPPPAPWLAIGPSVSLLTNFGRMLSGGFSVEAGVRVPGLSGYLYAVVESGYRYGRATDEVDLGGSVQTDLEIAPLHLILLFKPLPNALATPVLGIGGGLEFVQWSIRGTTGQIERDHTMLLGSLATVGGEVRLGPGAMVLHVRYLYAYFSDRAGVQQPDGRGGSVIKGNIGGLDVNLGYRLFF